MSETVKRFGFFRVDYGNVFLQLFSWIRCSDLRSPKVHQRVPGFCRPARHLRGNRVMGGSGATPPHRQNWSCEDGGNGLQIRTTSTRKSGKVWSSSVGATASQPKFTRTHFASRHSTLLAVPSKSHKYSHRAENNYGYYRYGWGERWRSWCRHYATRKEVPLSIPADSSYLHLPLHSNVHREVHTSPYDPSRPETCR